MINRVVTGGQTGVDRAALDAALDVGIACGGWCPRGRRAEDGRIPVRYPLTETPSARHIERTRFNVRDSDGTLVLTWGPPTGGTRATADRADHSGKPNLILDLARADRDPSTDATEILDWVAAHGIRVLNVAGPRASSGADIYPAARDLLQILLRQALTRQQS